MRADGVRTVVWVTPWTNLESADGQYPRDAASERMHRRPASNYSEAAIGGHFVRVPGGEPFVARWWMGTGSPIDFTSPAARRWWKAQARPVLELGVEGIKADDGEGYYFPPDVRFADGRTGAELAWDYGRLYRETMQEVLDEVHPGTGVLFGRCGWTGQQATGMLWGGDQASDFWSLRTLVAATLTAAASGFSNWSHDVGGYLGKLLVERCPRELLLRWVQFGCFTPLMQAHGRFAQEAWRYDDLTLDDLPRLRAAARAARPVHPRGGRDLRAQRPADHPPALSDRSSRPAGLGDRRRLRVRPRAVGGSGARGGRHRARPSTFPGGEWLDFWTRASRGRRPRGHQPRRRASGSPSGSAAARSSSRTRPSTWPRASATRRRPIARSRRRCGAGRHGTREGRLADGTEVRWERGEWSCSAEQREIRVRRARRLERRPWPCGRRSPRACPRRRPSPRTGRRSCCVGHARALLHQRDQVCRLDREVRAERCPRCRPSRRSPRRRSARAAPEAPPRRGRRRRCGTSPPGPVDGARRRAPGRVGRRASDRWSRACRRGSGRRSPPTRASSRRSRSPRSARSATSRRARRRCRTTGGPARARPGPRRAARVDRARLGLQRVADVRRRRRCRRSRRTGTGRRCRRRSR